MAYIGFFLLLDAIKAACSRSKCLIQTENSMIEQFSKHLFWDVDRSRLDAETHQDYIIKQVLEYGLLNDWVIIQKHYGIARIAQTATTFRVLDKKALSFIATLSHRPKEDFRCYTPQQSTPPHWDF